VNLPRLLLDEHPSPQVAARLQAEGVDAIHVRDRGLLEASDAAVLACGYREDRMVVTSNIGDFEKLARAVDLHPGLVLIEEGGLLRDEQLEVIRRAVGLVQIELNSGADMMNRVLRIWADLTYVFDDLP
jgi:predicted nuclease of predicted toxin-antitoxin system